MRLVVEIEVESAGEDAEISNEPRGSSPVRWERGDGVQSQCVEGDHCSGDGCRVGDEIGRRRFLVSDEGQDGIGFEVRDDECCVRDCAP